VPETLAVKFLSQYFTFKSIKGAYFMTQTKQEQLDKLLAEPKKDKRIVLRVNKEFFVNPNAVPEEKLIHTKDGDFVNILLSPYESNQLRGKLGNPLCYIGENMLSYYPVSVEFANELLGKKAYI
jgi:hypothetical protein